MTNLDSSFFFSEADLLRLLDGDFPDFDLAGDLLRLLLRLRLCLLSDLLLLLRDLVLDLDLERLRDLFFFLQ